MLFETEIRLLVVEYFPCSTVAPTVFLFALRHRVWERAAAVLLKPHWTFSKCFTTSTPQNPRTSCVSFDLRAYHTKNGYWSVLSLHSAFVQHILTCECRAMNKGRHATVYPVHAGIFVHEARVCIVRMKYDRAWI